MRTKVFGLLLGCWIAATSIAASSACQYHQTTADNEAVPAQVAQTDAPAPQPAPVVVPAAPAEPAGQTQSE